MGIGQGIFFAVMQKPSDHEVLRVWGPPAVPGVLGQRDLFAVYVASNGAAAPGDDNCRKWLVCVLINTFLTACHP